MNETVPAPNPYGALQQEARRIQAEERAAKHMANARSKLVLGTDAKSAFFAILALRLRSAPDWTAQTAWTDGRSLGYNPVFIDKLTEAERVGIVCHEVMHNALGHQARRGCREPKRWNIACDLAINSILKDTGFVLPRGGCFPGEGGHKDMPKGKSAEWYYSRLQEQPPDSGGGDGAGQGEDPGGCGAVRDASASGDQAEMRESEQIWQVATAQAERRAKTRGDLPAGLDRTVDNIISPKVDWREVLRRFVNRSAKNDYTWASPNRRHLHAGLYLPGLKSEELGRVALAVDTSGSIGPEILREFAAEVQGILESYTVQLRILFHDSAVAHEQEWTSEDGPIVLEAKGGGGTSHVPVFNRLNGEEPPVCLICLTDGETVFPSAEPEYPVLWALTQEVDVPFGESVLVE